MATLNKYNTDDLFSFLNEHNIKTKTISHPAVFTVEESKIYCNNLDGSHIKNLFVRNKKKKMYLIVALEDTKINLKDLSKKIEAGNLSFASPERMEQYLGVKPGSVTPLACINDIDNQVQLVIDSNVFAKDPIYCHPLINTMTTAISGADLKLFLSKTGHNPIIIDI